MKKVKMVLACMLTATLLFTGCKKAKDGKNGDAGPQGPQGAAGVVATSTDGYIKGTILGTRVDNTPFNETFDYTNFWGAPGATLDSLTPNAYLFNFSRGVDILKMDNASFNFAATSLTTTTGSITLNNFGYSKSLGTNKEFQFSTSSNVSLNATAISYDKNTGLFKGNFNGTISGNNNSSGHIATISGSFQVTVTQIYNIVKHTTPGVGFSN